jgi:hypothetical protein
MWRSWSHTHTEQTLVNLPLQLLPMSREISIRQLDRKGLLVCPRIWIFHRSSCPWYNRINFTVSSVFSRILESPPSGRRCPLKVNKSSIDIKLNTWKCKQKLSSTCNHIDTDYSIADHHAGEKFWKIVAFSYFYPWVTLLLLRDITQLWRCWKVYKLVCHL